MSSRPAKFKNDRKNMFPERFRKYRLVTCFMTPKPEDGAFDRVNRSSPSNKTTLISLKWVKSASFSVFEGVGSDGELRFTGSKAPSSGFGVIKKTTCTCTKRYSTCVHVHVYMYVFSETFRKNIDRFLTSRASTTSISSRPRSRCTDGFYCTDNPTRGCKVVTGS